MPLQLGCYSRADQTGEHAVKSMEGANCGIMTPEVGDIILVCSDGVTDNLGGNLLVRSLEAHLGSSAPAVAASITSSPGNVIERALEQLPYDIAGQCHRTASITSSPGNVIERALQQLPLRHRLKLEHERCFS